MLPVDSVLLSEAQVLAAWCVFAGSYVVFALGRFPRMKIDRTGAAIIGAVLMVALRVLGPSQALAAIDYGTIVLLFAMMVLVANLRLGGFFDRVAEWIVSRLDAPHVLPTIIGVCGVLSAFLVNDIVCLVMTPFVLHMVRRLGLPPVPHLVAVATASNIGSVATITGNPQNMLIGSLSGIAYFDFISHLGPVAAAGLLINWAVIHWIYIRPKAASATAPVATAAAHVDPVPAEAEKHGPMRRKPIVVLGLVLGGFLVGAPPPLVAAVGAAGLLITRTVEPRHVYAAIDWGLLVLFVGLFIIVAGADQSGLTARLLEPFATWDLHRLPVFVAVTAVFSNIVSNVPAVMLLQTAVASFPNPQEGWLILAMASTLAGNLAITGSVANIIVVERAAAEGIEISFGEYFRAGLPVTIATLVLGSLWLWLISP
jgi:Na+/H+ antiporter NhaD/arsenite permease-like protein